MLPIDPHLGMQIVNQHRREAEDEAAAYRLWRYSGARSEAWVARASRTMAAQAAAWLSTAGQWLDDLGTTGRLPPLDGQMRPSA